VIGETIDQPVPRDPAISDDDAAQLAKLETEQRWMDVLKLLAKHAELVAPANKAAYYLRIGDVYHHRFANQAEAIKAYERVLLHEPEHRRALDHLRALFEKRRDWEKLLELEKVELDRTAPEKRADKAVEVARLAAARVGKPDITIYWWQRVLEYEPDHRHALAELARSFERADRPMELATVLLQQVETAQGNDDRIAALRKLATVREEVLGDLEAARDAWQQIVETEPGDVDAKRALARIDAADAPVSTATLEPKKPAEPAAAVQPAEVPRAVQPAEPAKATPVTRSGEPSSATTIAIALAVLAIVGAAIYFLR
jgi:golgin subfamily B member 1